MNVPLAGHEELGNTEQNPGARIGEGGLPQLVQCFYFGFLILKEAQEFVFISFSAIISRLGLFEISFCDKNLKS